jgi:hypothetical protein
MSVEDRDKFFHLVYVEIPRKMKSGLRPEVDRDLTMDEYLKEFSVTFEAIILMMFETIPDYMTGEKTNQNRLTKEQEERQEARRVSLHSSTDGSGGEGESVVVVRKKRGGRPANKEGFNVDVFDKYRCEVWERREAFIEPSGGPQSQAHKDWKQRKADGFYRVDEAFYGKALNALNKINRETNRAPFSGSSSNQTSASERTSTQNIVPPSAEISNKAKELDDRASIWYKKVRGEKRVYTPNMSYEDVLKNKKKLQENPDGNDLGVKGV